MATKRKIATYPIKTLEAANAGGSSEGEGTFVNYQNSIVIPAGKATIVVKDEIDNNLFITVEDPYYAWKAGISSAKPSITVKNSILKGLEYGIGNKFYVILDGKQYACNQILKNIVNTANVGYYVYVNISNYRLYCINGAPEDGDYTLNIAYGFVVYDNDVYNLDSNNINVSKVHMVIADGKLSSYDGNTSFYVITGKESSSSMVILSYQLEKGWSE